MKEHLIRLIESYAAARVSRDPFLQQFAVSHLREYLAQVEIVKAASEEPPQPQDAPSEVNT
jgi:hypothetical protein